MDAATLSTVHSELTHLLEDLDEREVQEVRVRAIALIDSALEAVEERSAVMVRSQRFSSLGGL